MPRFNFSFDNVIEGQGIQVAITGMLIVFSALLLVTLFIAVMPRLLAILEPVLPAETERHGGPSKPKASPSAVTVVEDDVVAAIGFALYHQRRGGPQG